MSRLLLVTDSNFVNNIGSYKGQKIANLEVKSCQTRRAAMQEINTMEEGIAIIACLDMIASDVAKNTPNDVERAIEVYYTQLLHKLIEKIDDSNDKLAFGVVAPLFWTSHSETTKRAMNHAYKLLKSTPVSRIWFSDYLKDIRAGVDGVHLTSSSATKYIDFINNYFASISDLAGLGQITMTETQLDNAGTGEAAGTAASWAEDNPAETDPEAVSLLGPPDDGDMPSPTRTTTMLSTSILRTPTIQDLAPNTGFAPAFSSTQARLINLAGGYQDLSVPPPTVSNMLSQNPLSQNPDLNSCLARIERRIGKIESKSFYDNLTFAALKEEQDTEANKAMLNKVTVSGVVIEGIHSMPDADRVKAMRDKIEELIDNVKEEGQTFEVQFVRHLNKQKKGNDMAVIEVKLADIKQAKDFRAAFVKKRKSLPDKINVTPVVRLATRVRVEMMHSICLMLKKCDRSIDRAMCLQYVPKPVIKIVRKTAGGTEVSRTWSFIDAVIWVKEENLNDKIDFNKARQRAGAAFRGTTVVYMTLFSWRAG